MGRIVHIRQPSGTTRQPQLKMGKPMQLLNRAVAALVQGLTDQSEELFSMALEAEEAANA